MRSTRLQLTTLTHTTPHCTLPYCTAPYSSMTKEEVTAGVQQETLDASMQSVEGLESESTVHSDAPASASASTSASASAGLKSAYLSYISC